jgi:hypothetical protein
MATAATLLFVPVVFSVLHRTVPAPQDRESGRPTALAAGLPEPAHA